MQLLLDIGNSSVNWAIEHNDVFSSKGAFAYTNETFLQNIEDNFVDFEKPCSVLVSNVAGKTIFNSLSNWVNKKWQQECWQPKVSKEYKSLINSYQDTTQMGLDRWLSMVASWELNQSALCLVSCGTAMTIDLINNEGQHLGGYITPGIELMQKALINNTVQINTEIKKECSIEYAKDTQTAINNGAFIATVSMIDRVLEHFYAETSGEVKCIISGGMASLIEPLLKRRFTHEPNLVLKGLSILNKAR